jgi:hypothetical protein
VNRWKHIAYLIAIVLVAAAAFQIGSWRAMYLQARFDLAASVSTEAKLRKLKADSIRSDNEVRLRGAYLTLSSMPSWMSLFQPGTQPRNYSRQDERVTLIHDVLRERFGEDISPEEIAVVLRKHLSKEEVLRVSVR